MQFCFVHSVTYDKTWCACVCVCVFRCECLTGTDTILCPCDSRKNKAVLIRPPLFTNIVFSEAGLSVVIVGFWFRERSVVYERSKREQGNVCVKNKDKLKAEERVGNECFSNGVDKAAFHLIVTLLPCMPVRKAKSMRWLKQITGPVLVNMGLTWVPERLDEKGWCGVCLIHRLGPCSLILLGCLSGEDHVDCWGLGRVLNCVTLSITVILRTLV